ncbi:hypothetical protein WR25_25447 [Diploscapter pachys]|uniref:Uncharacterized protein n=1 Tax=Diploscapter pachys TaxID=2018661 RepID=A0A2A2M5C8_9BILA|nr:hypothetical protein WR25_25447 [Diploscapter pachys]
MRCARLIGMCCSMVGTQPSCCSSSATRPVWTSTSTPPSTKCASVKGAWSMTFSTAPCTVPWPMCARKTSLPRRRPATNWSAPAACRLASSAPKAKCAWPRQCSSSLRASSGASLRAVRARAISTSTRPGPPSR